MGHFGSAEILAPGGARAPHGPGGKGLELRSPASSVPAKYGRQGRGWPGPGVGNPKCQKTSNDGVGSGFQPVLVHFGSVEILTPGGAWQRPRGNGRGATATVSGAFFAKYGRLGRSRWGPGVGNPKCLKTSNYGVGSGFQQFLGHFGSVENLTPGGAGHRPRATGRGATATVSGAFFAKYGRLGRSRWGPGVQSPKCLKLAPEVVSTAILAFEPLVHNLCVRAIAFVGAATCVKR